METIFFQTKKYHPEEQGDEISVTNKKIFFVGIGLIGLGILLFGCNYYLLQNDKFEKITGIIGITGFMIIATSSIQYQSDNEIVSGNIRGTITFEESKILIDNSEFIYDKIANFKFITTEYRGKDPNFHRINLEFNNINNEVGKGVMNWISFSHENKHYKYFFLLENKKHQEDFLKTMELLKSKMSIKKAYDFN